MLDRQSVLGDLRHDLGLSLGEPVETVEEEEEIESELVEYAAFEGDRETVLQNTTLQYAMFLVLRTIARQAEKGTLTAITERDGELESWRIVEGPADDEAANSGVNWRDNKFISD